MFEKGRTWFFDCASPPRTATNHGDSRLIGQVAKGKKGKKEKEPEPKAKAKVKAKAKAKDEAKPKEPSKSFKVCVCGGAGGIGQPLSMLMAMDGNVGELSVFDLNVAMVPPAGVAADLNHIEKKAAVFGRRAR